MDDQPTEAPKSGVDLKDPNAPKATYNLSTKERARRAATKRVNAAKRRAAKSTKAAEDKRRYARKLEQQATKVENALVGNASATIDLGDVADLPDPVSDLSERAKSFSSRMTDLKQTFFRRVSETYSTAVLPVVEKVLHFLLIRYVIVTILIIVGFFSVVHSTN